MSAMSRAIEPYVTGAGEPRYKVRFRHAGRQSSRTFASDEGARTFVRLLDTLGADEAVRVLDERTGAPSGVVTLGEYALAHIDRMTGVGEDYRRRCRRLVTSDLKALADRPLTAITTKSVAAWVNGLESAGQSGKTIKNKHGFLSAVMKAAVRDRIIDANPCAGTRLPRSVVPAMTFLTPDEYATFLGYFTPRWQPMVALMFGTGARFSELTALTVSDVDPDHGTVSITKAWKDNGKHVGPPKSRRSVRTVTLAPETTHVLRELCEGRPGTALVVTNQRGGPVRLQTFHDNVWGPAVRLANGEPARAGKRVARRRDAHGNVIAPAKVPLGKRPRCHDARHSHASWLLAAGAPLNVVQAQLGHESITTTSDRYGHLMPSSRAAVSTALSLALTGAHPLIEA
jgi:integrase